MFNKTFALVAILAATEAVRLKQDTLTEPAELTDAQMAKLNWIISQGDQN